MKKKNSSVSINKYLDKHLHIVAFDVPYPADYGGVSDVFSRITWLFKSGFKIHLHCFTSSREPQPVLQTFCETVDYYRRKSPLASLSATIPYIVLSRKSPELENALLKDNYPILLEGVHCSALVLNPAFKNRQILLRQHNVEYKYYAKLAEQEENLLKKLYFSVEAHLLKRYEKTIAGKARVLAINEHDLKIFEQEFRSQNPVFIPAFTPWNQIKSVTGRGDYCLYHGNLSVIENEVAVKWLIEKVFNQLPVKLIIAGKSPSQKLLSLAKNNTLLSFVENPTDEVMQQLISNAHVNVLPSFNNTGVKLKLLNALFNGRHCVVNPEMVEGSGLTGLCHLGRNPQEFVALISSLRHQDFTAAECDKRRELLSRNYNNQKNAILLSSLIR